MKDHNRDNELKCLREIAMSLLAMHKGDGGLSIDHEERLMFAIAQAERWDYHYRTDEE